MIVLNLSGIDTIDIAQQRQIRVQKLKEEVFSQ